MMREDLNALKREFDENGFVVVENLLDAATLENLRLEIDEITNNSKTLAPNLAGKLFFERQHVANNPQWYDGLVTPKTCGEAVRQIADLPLFGQSFADLICCAPMLDMLEKLFASSEFSFSMMLARPKAARVGNGIGNGNFHRDTPFEYYTEAETVVVILCLDEMTGEANGATGFVRGSHKISDAEAAKEEWINVERANFSPEEIVSVKCPAGSAIFFDTKVLHSAGHNRSENPRRTIQMEFVGENSLPVSPERYVFQGLKPRSRQAAFIKQIEMTFPHLSMNKSFAKSA